MKTIKVFVASSNTLLEERTEIEKIISRKNDDLIKSNIYLKVVIWEKHSKSFSQTRKQEEFNKLVEDSDIFICLIYDKVGQFTLEEFERAYKSFEKHSKPKYLYIYFKEKPLKISEISDYESIVKLKNTIKQKEQIWSTYETTHELLNYISNELDLITAELKSNNENTDDINYEIEFVHTIIDILDKDASKTKFTKFQLIKALRPFQYFHDSIIVDGFVDINSINVDKGVNKEVIRQINHVEINTNLGYLHPQNERITKTLTCNLINSFPSENEVWEDNNINNVGFIKTTIIFPFERKYKSFHTRLLKRGQNEIEIFKTKEIIINGRHALDFEYDNRKIINKIRNYWVW